MGGAGMALRGVLLLAGLVLGVVGLVNLLGEGWRDVGHVLGWFAVGVLAHDALLSGLAILLGLLVVRFLPSAARAPTVVGLVVVATVTLAVLPTLVMGSVETANSSLLDRPYTWNWLGFVAVVALGVLGASWWMCHGAVGRHDAVGRHGEGTDAERGPDGQHPRG